MTNNKLKTHYKPNVVYELLIHGVYHYIGCHTIAYNSYLRETEVIKNSGNYLAEARNKGLITLQEYKECVELVNVWEFDTKEEALDFETLKIQEYKEKYGDLCKNKALYGNQYGNKGILGSPGNKGYQFTREDRKRMSDARKNYYKTHEVWNKGVPQKEEARLRNQATNKLYKWFTNGIVVIRAKECPEGFKPGRKIK